MTFTFENPALQPARYTLIIHEDGTGRYQSEPGSASAEDPNGLVPQAQNRAITIANPLRAQLFAVARKQGFFAKKCETKSAKVAYTGAKTLRYLGPEGAGSCTYNYAHDSKMQEITESLKEVAATLEEGRKFDLLLAHDRLGLEDELARLSRDQAEGRALDLENIAPVLRRIAESDQVLNHTREQARTLLAVSTGHAPKL